MESSGVYDDLGLFIQPQDTTGLYKTFNASKLVWLAPLEGSCSL